MFDTDGLAATRVLFVTNFCPHYRVKAFEELARRIPTRFLFFSKGTESYWEKKNPVGHANIESVTVAGVQLLPKFRISLTLLKWLWGDMYDTAIKCTNGRIELPLTFLITKVRGKKFILWQTLWYHPRTAFHLISMPILRWIWRRSDAIVVYGQHGKDFLVDEGVNGKKIFIAWQSVDNEMYSREVTDGEKTEVRRRLQLNAMKVILYVGQLIEVKGLEFLIEAYRLLGRKDAALVLIGTGPLDAALRRQAQSLPNVHFIGYIPPTDLRVYYSLARLLVLPSISLPMVKEAWGLVINEAMNQGCPIVASNAVGAAVGGLVIDGQNGFVVPERNSVALASALARILDDDALASRMSASSLESIRHFTQKEWADGFVSAVRYVVGQTNAPVSL